MSMMSTASQSSVVRVYATAQEPDHVNPWQASSPTDSTGSGVVLSPGRVLTGAHVVADATFLQVQRVADPDKFVARVHGVCHDTDLALLVIDDPRFMDEVTPAELGELPEVQDRVAVVGYPVGGDEISVTEGVVSRIEVQTYTHSQRRMLAVTIDAAINAGNSGGPVLDDEGRVVGIAFQALEDAESIGEVVPVPLVRRFLEGVEAGRPPAVPGLGIRSQNLENPTLRRRLGLAEGERGVLVVAVDYGSSCWGVVEPGDVLLSVAGTPIANNGTIRYQGRHRTGFDVVLGEHFLGDALPVTLLREGERREATLELREHLPLVPLETYDKRPDWFVFGGLVFQSLSCDYLGSWDDWWDKAPKNLLHHYAFGRRTEQRREIVVLSQVLADEVNVGYTRCEFATVDEVNGEVPADLADFVTRVDAATDLVEITLEGGQRLVLDAAEARASASRIQERYRVPGDRSPGL